MIEMYFYVAPVIYHMQNGLGHTDACYQPDNDNRDSNYTKSGSSITVTYHLNNQT